MGRPVCRSSLYLNPRHGRRISHFSRGALIFLAAAFQKKKARHCRFHSKYVRIRSVYKQKLKGAEIGAAPPEWTRNSLSASRLLNEEQLKRGRRADRRSWRRDDSIRRAEDTCPRCAAPRIRFLRGRRTVMNK